MVCMNGDDIDFDLGFEGLDREPRQLPLPMRETPRFVTVRNAKGEEERVTGGMGWCPPTHKLNRHLSR